jgi:GTP-binding protein HflX
VDEADLLIHVVDVSSHNLLQKAQAVDEVLAEIGAGDKPHIIALNKVDLIDPETLEARVGRDMAMTRNPMAELLERYEYVVPISAAQGVGIEELLEVVNQMLCEHMVSVQVTLPYAAGDLLDLWHKHGVVDEEQYTPGGVQIRGKLPLWVAGMVEDN